MQENGIDQPVAKVSGQSALLAWALILGGVFVTVFVLIQLFAAYVDIDGNEFVGALAERLSDSTVMTLGDIPVTLTEQGARIMAYFVFIPIALLGVHIAVALIRAGSHIMSPMFPYQISRLKQRIDRLSDKVDVKETTKQ